jgi:hypothetical protein
VNYADYKSGLYAGDPKAYTQFRILHSADGAKWEVMADLGDSRRDRPNAYIELPAPVRTRFVRYEHGYVGAANLAVSDLRVFGDAGGRPPASAPARVAARRGTDPRNAAITWAAVPGAVGYNVRWGIRPDRLHQTYQVFADKGPRLELRALTKGQGYHVAVEAFDENGVSPLSRTVALP